MNPPRSPLVLGTGSFSAVSLFNSNLFNMDVLYIDQQSIVAAVSMTYSAISILLACFTIYTQKKTLDAQAVLMVEFDVNSADIQSNRKILQNRTHVLRSEMSGIIGVSKNVIVVNRCKMAQNKGLRVWITMKVVDVAKHSKDVETTINANAKSGNLAAAVQKAWGLQALPSIGNVKVTMSESKRTMAHTIHMTE
eukprot:477904_1